MTRAFFRYWNWINDKFVFIFNSSKNYWKFKQTMNVVEYIEKFHSGTYADTIKFVSKEAYYFRNTHLNAVFSNFNKKVKSISLRSISEEFVLHLKNGGILIDSNLLVVTNEGILLRDVSRVFGKRVLKIRPTSSTYRVRNSGVKNGVLLTTAGESTYYHWLFDILPRLGIFNNSIQFESTPEFIFSNATSSYQKETLKLLGIDKNVINVKSHFRLNSIIRFDNLWVPSLPSDLGAVSPSSIEFLRHNFLPFAKNSDIRKIYISRVKAKDRKLTNEMEIIELLKNRGFYILTAEEYSFMDQVNIFRSAEIIIAPHGSGLSNLVFCDQGTKVIELFSSNNFVPCFMDLAFQLNLDYNFLCSEESDNYPYNNYWEGSSDNFAIKTTKILSLI